MALPTLAEQVQQSVQGVQARGLSGSTRSRAQPPPMEHMEPIAEEKSEVAMDIAEDSSVRKIKVGSIPKSVKDADLVAYFEHWGKVESGMVMMDRNAKGECVRHRGFGYVTFQRHAAAQAAVSAQHRIQGHTVTVERCNPLMRTSQQANKNRDIRRKRAVQEGSSVLSQQFKQQTEYLHQVGDQQKRQYSLDVDQQMKTQERASTATTTAEDEDDTDTEVDSECSSGPVSARSGSLGDLGSEDVKTWEHKSSLPLKFRGGWSPTTPILSKEKLIVLESLNQAVIYSDKQEQAGQIQQLTAQNLELSEQNEKLKAHLAATGVQEKDGQIQQLAAQNLELSEQNEKLKAHLAATGVQVQTQLAQYHQDLFALTNQKAQLQMEIAHEREEARAWKRKALEAEERANQVEAKRRKAVYSAVPYAGQGDDVLDFLRTW